jgi:hypothetical protein
VGGTEVFVPDIVGVWDQTGWLTRSYGDGRRRTIQAHSVSSSTAMQKRSTTTAFGALQIGL